MRKIAVLALVTVFLCGLSAQPPKKPNPTKEHQWLHQLAGEWETDGEMLMGPNTPPVKSKGTESTRMLGGFWLVSEMKGDCLGTPFTGILTVGYDSQKKKYIGTWVCSMCDYSCTYEGRIEGKKLILDCQAPHPETGKLVRMRNLIESKDKDTKTMTSQMLTDDGKWITFMTLTARRKK